MYCFRDCTTPKRHFFVLVHFRALLLVHGSAYLLVFTMSRHGRSVLLPGDWQSLLLCIYIPAPFTVIWPVRKENDFASKVPERESNSRYTDRVDPFPSPLSTRPTPLWVFGRCKWNIRQETRPQIQLEWLPKPQSWKQRKVAQSNQNLIHNWGNDLSAYQRNFSFLVIQNLHRNCFLAGFFVQ